jgi:hypothetical protein
MYQFTPYTYNSCSKIYLSTAVLCISCNVYTIVNKKTKYIFVHKKAMHLKLFLNA